MDHKGLKLLISIFFCFGLLLLLAQTPVLAQDDEGEEVQAETTSVKAKITSINRGTCKEVAPDEYPESGEECIVVLAEVISGGEEGKVVQSVQNMTSDPLASTQEYHEGDKVWLVKSTVAGETTYSLDHVDRTAGLIWLAGIFVVLVLVVSRLQGAMSLAGMAVSVLAIFGVVVPSILKGRDPILYGGVAAFLILVVSIYLSHGFNKKTTIALAGTTATLLVTLLVAFIFSKVLKLTGFGSEEAYYLVQRSDVSISMSKVFIASIILGSIGILDDVTVSQVAVIQALYEENPKLEMKELYNKSMKVGKDHIASMVNTLFLVYAGAALPMVLLFQISGTSYGQIVHHEQFTEEIVRTIVGSIGLVLAVPITTLLAARVYSRKAHG